LIFFSIKSNSLHDKNQKPFNIIYFDLSKFELAFQFMYFKDSIQLLDKIRIIQMELTPNVQQELQELFDGLGQSTY